MQGGSKFSFSASTNTSPSIVLKLETPTEVIPPETSITTQLLRSLQSCMSKNLLYSEFDLLSSLEGTPSYDRPPDQFSCHPQTTQAGRMSHADLTLQHMPAGVRGGRRECRVRPDIRGRSIPAGHAPRPAPGRPLQVQVCRGEYAARVTVNHVFVIICTPKNRFEHPQRIPWWHIRHHSAGSARRCM